MKKITLLTSLFISANLIAQNFSLIKEINTTATNSSFGTSIMQQVGTIVYFPASDGINGNELWKSDGTNGGTVMVKDITPGVANTVITLMAGGNGLLFFVVNDVVNGPELWRSDGTNAGTFRLRSFGACPNCLNRLFFHNGLLFFEGDDGVSGLELWKSDGTVAGTVMVADIYPGSNSSSPTPFSNPIYTMVAMGNDVYFSALGPTDGRELYKTNGTAAGTMMVKDIYPGGNGSNTANHKAAVFNGKLYFSATDNVNGTELWATDGTDAGTYRVKDIVAGTGSSQPNNLIAFNGALYFTASSTNNAAPDLWKTDGTDAGTVLVRNLVADGINLSIGSSATIDQFTIANGKLFFRGTSSSGLELYVTDGTTAGTGLVKDLNPGVNGINPNGLFVFNNNVYFQGGDAGLPSRGGTLYKSDGTSAGTVQVIDAAGIAGVPSPAMSSADGRLFFYGNTSDHGIELWSTDGTSANTVLVKDINSIKIGTPNSGSSLSGSIVFNGYYYYAAVDDTHGNELWRSDGTTAGTTLVKDIWPGKGPSNPAQFFLYGSAIYFTASEGVNGTELWKTDGTEAGTVLIADINPGAVNSSPNRFGISNNLLYFTAYHSLYGNEIWRSDGTAAGTTMVIDLVPGMASGSPGPLEVVSLGNSAYGIINIAAGNVLGIPAGNRLVKFDGVSNTISDFASFVTTGIDLAVVGNTLYVTGRNSSNQTLLWKSDNGGALTQVKVLSTTATNAFQLTNCGGKLYFGASNGTAAGVEPWVSDGTDAGTFMLKDINPGTNPSTPYQFVFSGGKVFFTASSTGNANGEYELWATDGTTAGTYLVKDIQPGSTGSRPNSTISAFGNKILFTANDGASGYELWQSDGTTTGTFLLQEFNTNGEGIPAVTSIFINFTIDFVYSKLGDKILFFARSADKGLQLYTGSIASPYKYVNDNSTANDLFTTAIGNNANNGSQSAPYATLSYAISQAQAGDTIYVDAGIYFEQVTIDKGITLLGAGSGLTIVWKPAVINPPPGPFTEPGTIQTTQNIGDVHIRDMSVTGDDNGVTPLVLQTGGSVKNCRLIGGNQGIFFRVDPAVKTALIENNYINVAYIGINCQGSGLSASLINNTIELTNPFFAAGVYGGLDFGPLVRFTAFGNIIRNYNAQGILANSYNTNITQNNITGTGAHAIEQSTNSLGFATCNWYGTTNAGVIASKVSGFFSYTPYLTDGTNTITTYGNYGFLPVAGTCAEGVSNFYVNDNSLTNDVFTTAAGSNSNAGTRSAPFATLSYAISVAPANSVIHVDAGTYAEQVIIDRGIVINGAGKNLTNFIKPATTLVPAPGSFTEIGLIETTQGIGDVHIRNISVNSVDGSSQNIIIQSGGSVKNCKLLNGGQGVFFRIASGSRNAEVSFNTIQPTGIGINCQGAGLTANIVNNTISNPAGYYSGIFAGLDFGPLPQLTITNNSINNYFGSGMSVNCNGSNISNNSILGTGSRAIEGGFSGNRLNASCNWYGSADPNVLIPKMYGNINYSPWLTNGTDNDVVSLGFQPLPDVCNMRQNKFYVNDNSLTGGVFTTAVGDDNNGGAPSAPLLTIATALSRAQAGDSIFVDAGTYAMANLDITKSVTILGSNYNLSPNNAADRLAINPVRNAEAMITGSTFTISSNDVRLEGLSFNPGAKSQVVMANTGVNNFTFKRNNSIITFGTLLSLIGPSSTPLGQPSAFGNYLIEDNRFESQSISICTGVIMAAVNDVTVNNNTFITSASTTQRVFIHSQVLSGGLTVNYTYTNNISYASRADLFSTALPASATFENNITLQCFRSILLQGNIFVSTDIKIRNNYIETDFADGTVSPIHYTVGGTTLPGAIATALIENNTVIQGPGGRSFVPTAILARLSGNIENSLTTIRKNKISFTGNYNLFTNSNVFGIGLFGKLQTVNIQENEIAFTGTNLTNAIPSTDLSASGISISSDFGPANPLASNAVMNITGNKISGFRNSIAVYDASILAPNTYVGYGNLPEGIIVNINNNSFTGDVVSINNGNIGQSVNATCNWYGTASAQGVLAKVTPSTVIYSPWLTSGIDSDIPAVGFQPAGVCNGTVPVITLNASTNVTCFGANNGTINISVSGGASPFNYSWTKNGVPEFASSSEDLANLAPGTYNLMLTDANGSIVQLQVTISQPSLLTASATGTNVSCFNGSNGTSSVTAGGGTLPYTYLWSNGSTNASITNLSAGIYSITVTDGNGCTKSSSYQVTQPALLTAAASGTSTSCANTATVAVSGGTLPYSYAWNNGATTQSITSIPAGTYTVIVTDNKGCTASSSVTVTASEAFNPSASVTDVSCFGGSTGSITITNVNGVSPFQFSLNGVNFSTPPSSLPYTISGLAAGAYTVTVKDANGCTGFVEKTINQPAQLLITQNIVQRTCSGSSTGSISVTVSGGSPSYSYQWNGPGFSSTQANINGLAAGNYTVTVTDSKGCTASTIITVSAFPAINVTVVEADVLCRGNASGSIDLTVTGGSGSGFSYAWSNGATTQDVFNLAGGNNSNNNYNVTILDLGSNCPVTLGFSITQPSSVVSVTVNSQSINSVNGCNTLGSFTAQGSNGTQFPSPNPYQYSINGVDFQTSPTFNNLVAKDYTVTVKDANGCTATKTITIGDTGSDEYEGANNNNSKGKAAPISLGTTVSARLGVTNDIDYYKLSPSNSWIGNYTLTVVQSLPGVTIDLVKSNGTDTVGPTSSSGNYKYYNIPVSSTYYIRVSGANSLNCYQFTVSSGLITRSSGTSIQQEVTKAPVKDGLFDVKVLGNPSSIGFVMNVITSSNEKISMRVFNAQGQLIEERQGLQPFETLKFGERYINGMYMAEIRQGKKSKTVRLIKM